MKTKISAFVVLVVAASILSAQNQPANFAGMMALDASKSSQLAPKAGDAPQIAESITLPLAPSITLNPPPLYWPRMRVWQGIPSIEVSDGGRLWATWYSGNVCEGAGRHFAILATSGDGGATWKEVAVYDPAALLEGSAGDPSLWKNDKGEVFWIINRKLSFGSGTNPRSCWYIKIKNPENDNPAFGEPIFVARAVELNKPAVLKKDGRILMPFNKMEKNEKRIIFFSARQDGSDVKLVSEWGIDDGSISEPMAYERRDGVIVCLVRSNSGILSIESCDGGATWTNPAKFPLQVSVGTRFNIARLKSGNLILVANDHPKARNNMTVFLSEDDGKTWPHKLPIDEREAVSYPDAAEGEDGFIYVIHDRGRYNKDAQEILFSKITEADIKAGKLVNPQSKLKGLISNLAPFGGGVNADKETVEMQKLYTAKKGK